MMIPERRGREREKKERERAGGLKPHPFTYPVASLGSRPGFPYPYCLYSHPPFSLARVAYTIIFYYSFFFLSLWLFSFLVSPLWTYTSNRAGGREGGD
ncbi:hypothetical protein LX36DRAFT_106554 [Colletotrichum falcatum]|nr:hypothetical protein LX36DRAFT_106554 [Colletotrichum falcatum]